MISKVRKYAPIFRGLLLVCSLSASAQVSIAPHDPADSLNQIAEELKDRFGQVRFHREEALEDRFTSRGLQTSAFRFLPHVFQVQKQPFDLSTQFALENTSSDLPTMYVASSAQKDRVYRLYGFPEPEEEFNRLVAESSPQEIKGIGDAELRGLLCAEIVYGFSSQWWVADSSNAKLQAAEFFFSAGRKDGLLRAEKWWKAIGGDRAKLAISTVKDDHGGFEVTLPVFWGPVEGKVVPQVRSYLIEVGESGTCQMKRSPISILK